MINCPGSGLVRFFHFFFFPSLLSLFSGNPRDDPSWPLYLLIYFSLSLSPRQPIIYYIHYINNVSFRLTRLVSTFHVKMKKTRKPAFLGYHFFFFLSGFIKMPVYTIDPPPTGPFGYNRRRRGVWRGTPCGRILFLIHRSRCRMALNIFPRSRRRLANVQKIKIIVFKIQLFSRYRRRRPVR